MSSLDGSDAPEGDEFMDEDQDEYEDEADDPELMMAIAMSMVQEQPGGPPPAAGGAPAAGSDGAAAAGGAPPTVSAAALQQALMASLAAVQQGMQQPAAPPAAQQPRARRAAAPAAPVFGPPPAWLAAAMRWAPEDTAPAAAALPDDPAALAAVQEACAAALGLPVAVPGAAGGAAPGAAPLPAAPAAGGGAELTAAAVDAALARLPAGDDPVGTLHAAWARAAAAAAAPGAHPAAAAAARLCGARAAARAAGVLARDEDDLFFEGGRHRSRLLEGLGSGRLSPGFLDAVVAGSAGVGAAPAAALWEGVLRDAFGAFKDFSFGAPERHAGALAALDALTRGAPLRGCLAAALLREAAASAAGAPGGAAAAGSLLGPLLAAASPAPGIEPRAVLPLRLPARECLAAVRGYPRARGAVGPELAFIRSASGRLLAGAHEVLRRAAAAKPGAPGAGTPAAGREAVPAWLAALAGDSVARAEAGSYVERVLHHRGARAAAQDGPMLSAAALALRLCRPFLASPDAKEGALRHLDPRFFVDQRHRVRGAERERSLAGTLIAPAPADADGGAPPPPFPNVSPDRAAGQAPPHFVAECFFAALRLLHVGLVPATYRFAALARLLRDRARAGGGGSDDDDGDDGPLDGGAGGATLDEWLLADSYAAALLDPELAADAVHLCELAARWLTRLLGAGDGAARAALAAVPESVVRDACAWLCFVIRHGAAELLGGADVGALVGCLTALLRRPDLVPSPAVHFSCVQLLLAMLSPQLARSRRGRAGALSRGAGSPAEAALVSAVLATGAAQTELLPALMAVYAHADHVVGLDVDADAYDKFHLRTLVDELLMELWADPACGRSLSDLAERSGRGGGGGGGGGGAGGPAGGAGPPAAAGAGAGAGAGADPFPPFCGAVLNDLVYLLRDALGRFEDIAAVEAAQADAAGWAALPPAERAGKEDFLAGQRRAAAGFLAQARTTLRMLNALVAARGVPEAFVRDAGVAARAAAACLAFMGLLAGPRAARMRVADPARYGFDPGRLLAGVARFAARLGARPEFVAALAADPDADAGVLRAAAAGVAEYDVQERLAALADAVDAARGGGAGAGGASAGAAGGGGGAGATAADVAALPLATAPEPPGVADAYAAELEPLAVGEFDACVPRAFSRRLLAMADAAAAAAAPGKAKALAKELRALRGRQRPPVHAPAAVFVRSDAERLDLARCLITGPEGTPYAGGCFFFDALFPADYPHAPPLLECETTGGGTARLSPNLYADGKVCLSLLGTWHGGHASEKWDPARSSLFQVLVSIQSMILVADPYFNEPSYDAMRGTAEGAAASLRYNAELWLATVRHAMVDVLKRPRPGFEDVIRAHFRLLRHRIARQAAAWAAEAEGLGADGARRLREAVVELHGLLEAL